MKNHVATQKIYPKKISRQEIKEYTHAISELLDCVQALMALEFKPIYVQNGLNQHPFYKTLPQRQINIFINEAKEVLGQMANCKT